jgi:ArsR family transcriptional regulator, virulence genes transcriptional regulator
MKFNDARIFELHADFCKILSSAKRLMIIELLADGELSVSAIAQALHAQHSNVSQHLTVLRSRNVVETRKEGQTVYYRLTNARLPRVCAEIRRILLEGMARRGSKAERFIATR